MPSKLGKKHPKYQPPKICHKSEIGPGYIYITPPAVYVPKAMRILVDIDQIDSPPTSREVHHYNITLTKTNPPAGFSGDDFRWPTAHASAAINLVGNGPNWHVQLSTEDANNLITIWTRPDAPLDFRQPVVLRNDGLWSKIQDQGDQSIRKLNASQTQ